MDSQMIIAGLFFYGLFATFAILVLLLKMKQTTCRAEERTNKWRNVAEHWSAVYDSKQGDNRFSQ